MFACLRACICMQLCVCVCSFVRLLMCASVRVRVCSCARLYVLVHVRTCDASVSMYAYVSNGVLASVLACTSTCASMYVRVRIFVHVRLGDKFCRCKFHRASFSQGGNFASRYFRGAKISLPEIFATLNF